MVDSSEKKKGGSSLSLLLFVGGEKQGEVMCALLSVKIQELVETRIPHTHNGNERSRCSQKHFPHEFSCTIRWRSSIY